MTTDALANVPERRSVAWFEESIPVRGCRLTLEVVKDFYLELSRINREFGQRTITDLDRDESMSDEEWADFKELLLDDAFRLTVTIVGHSDQRVYGEDADIFAADDLPDRIKCIYFNNITAFRRHANDNIPRNRLEVTLDFDKPALLDPNLVVSEATPNISQVQLNANEISFFRAVQGVIDTKLKNHRTWYGFLHKNFSYDLGMWVFALPVALFFSSHLMDRLLPINSQYSSFRIAFFIYASGLMLLLYRFLSSYAKWAFPVNVLVENRDKAVKHRILIGALATWLFFQLADTLYSVVM